MNPEEYNQVMSMQSRLAQSEANSAKMQQALTMFQDKEENNLVKYQLDPEKELIRIQRLLEKQEVKRDDKGNLYYSPCDSSKRVLNDYGVSEVMSILQTYVNKNIMLSYYEPEQIDKIMYELGEELIDFFYINMEKLGLDTPDKKKHYKLIVTNLINTIDAIYRKALWGKQLELISKNYVVSQTDGLNNTPFYPQMKTGLMGKFKSMFKT